jgi:hypothetical protein
VNTDFTKPNQKGRKDSQILSFLIPLDLLDGVNNAVQQQQQNTRGVPLSRSAWILRAIRRELAHAERSRVKRGAK